MRLTINTDGGARGNPGPAAIGIVIKNAAGDLLYAHGEYIGKTTNNQAEYRALLQAVKKAFELGGAEIHCFLDSELLVRQLNYQYKVKDKNLAPLFLQVVNIAQHFKKITYTHIPRAANTAADALVNEALDEALKRH